MAGVSPTSGNILRNVVTLLRALGATPSSPDKANAASSLRGQALVQPNGTVEGPGPLQSSKTLDQPSLKAVQLEYTPPAGGFDPYARRGTYLDITV